MMCIVVFLDGQLELDDRQLELDDRQLELDGFPYNCN